MTGKTEQKSKRTLGIWTCTDHGCHWPVGVASVVVAEDEGQAREMLRAELEKRLLPDQPFTLNRLPMKPQAVVLCDGNN